MKRAALAALVVAFAACSARTPTAVETTPPPDGSPSPSPSPSASPVHVAVARMVTWADADGLWTYDVAKNVATEVAKGSDIRSPRWATPKRIVFIQDQGAQSTLRMFDLGTKAVTDLFSIATGIRAFAMTPDQQLVAYITVDQQSYPHLDYRFLVGGQATQTVSTLARAPGRGTDPSDEMRMQFSPDGTKLLSIFTPADGDPGQTVHDDASQLQVRSIDGSLLYGVDMTRNPTMGFWSPDGRKVYYRTDSGARAWSRSSGTSQPVSSVKWFDPSPSPDGKTIAYDNGVFDAKVQTLMLDIKSGAKTAITGTGFAWPVFASPKVVWVQRATPCSPNCAEAVQPGPEVFAIDVKTKKATKLALPTLQDVGVLYV